MFGKCIAGKGFAGNMGYFKLIAAMAAWGPATAVASMVIGAMNLTGHESATWIVLAVLVLFVVAYVVVSILNCRFRYIFYQQSQDRELRAAHAVKPAVGVGEVECAGVSE
jgi:hypothetical protein